MAGANEQSFKFLTDKPVSEFKNIPQFLHMLKAEEEGLIKIDIYAQAEQSKRFLESFLTVTRTNDWSEVALAWNELRKQMCYDLLHVDLIPMATRWVREHLKVEAEDWIADAARSQLEYVSSLGPIDAGDVDGAADQYAPLFDRENRQYPRSWCDAERLGVEQRSRRHERRRDGRLAGPRGTSPHPDQI
jgi:transcription elongation factor SPT6